jgi:ATP-dependent helicase HepA
MNLPVPFIVGQRWASHSDSQLGLGIVIETIGRRVTLSFPAAAETRTFAIDNAPLSRIRYAVGDWVSNMDDEQFIINSISESGGLLIYHCHDVEQQDCLIEELDLNCFVQFTTPEQRLFSGQLGRSSEFELRFETFRQQYLQQLSPVSGLMGSRTNLLEHQVYITQEVAKRYSPRVLLADEVGLGKTIEAGMILHHQIHSGQTKRVLIIVPPTLLHQWLVEMLRRFNLSFSIFDHSRIYQPQNTVLDEDDIEIPQPETDENPFDSEQRILCSLDFIVNDKAVQQQILETEWDMVIVDEAHHLYWQENNPSDSYAFVEQLSAICKGLLLLTATPEQVGIEGHFARLKLLDPARFHDLEKFKREEAGYVDLNTILQQLLDDPNLLTPEQLQQLASYLGQENNQPQNSVLKKKLQQPQGVQNIVDDLLDRHGTGRVLFRNTRTAVQGFPKRILNLEPLPCPEIYNNRASKTLLYPEIEADEEQWIRNDPRVAWMVAKLKQLKPKKVLVICHHKETAIALDKYLNLKAGIRSTSFYEGLSIIDRDRAAAYFAEEDQGAQVLICSEIGSEGRNFQFSHHLVLFDLPQNPDLIEQRIGRLDRIGQQHDIQIHLPYIQQTAQQILFEWFHEGLNLFQQSCSAGYQIYQKFMQPLEAAIQGETKEFDALVSATKKYTAELLEQLQQGRDRLLELNSCNHDVAKNLIEKIQAQEDENDLSDYLESVFDRFGVEHEPHSENAIIVRPGEHMLNDHFPHIQEDGSSMTFNRDYALSREDLEFVSWEHPMVNEILEMITNSEFGNATVASISIKGLSPGTLLLETFYTIDALSSQLPYFKKYLNSEPVRFLFDSNGKNLSAAVPHHKMNKLCQKVKKKIAQTLISRIRTEIETMLTFSETQMKNIQPEIINKAQQQLNQEMGAELERLKSLAQVNPNIRTEEIEFLEQQIIAGNSLLDRSSIQLQGIRVIINS